MTAEGDGEGICRLLIHLTGTGEAEVRPLDRRALRLRLHHETSVVAEGCCCNDLGC